MRRVVLNAFPWTQVWDGANKKWEKAADLEAISVGSKRISFTGTTPKVASAMSYCAPKNIASCSLVSCAPRADCFISFAERQSR